MKQSETSMSPAARRLEKIFLVQIWFWKTGVAHARFWIWFRIWYNPNSHDVNSKRRRYIVATYQLSIKIAQRQSWTQKQQPLDIICLIRLHVDIKWQSRRLKSPAFRLFAQEFVWLTSIETSKPRPVTQKASPCHDVIKVIGNIWCGFVFICSVYRRVLPWESTSPSSHRIIYIYIYINNRYDTAVYR